MPLSRGLSAHLVRVTVIWRELAILVVVVVALGALAVTTGFWVVVLVAPLAFCLNLRLVRWSLLLVGRVRDRDSIVVLCARRKQREVTERWEFWCAAVMESKHPSLDQMESKHPSLDQMLPHTNQPPLPPKEPVYRPSHPLPRAE